MKRLFYLSRTLLKLGFIEQSASIIKLASNDFISKWSDFLISSNENLSYGVKFVPVGLDEDSSDYQDLVEQNKKSFEEIESNAELELPIFLGAGTRGAVFDLGGNKVLKFMTDPYEFQSYQVMKDRRLRGGELSLEAPEIFALGELKDKGNNIFSYWVIMEKLKVPKETSGVEVSTINVSSLLLDMLSMILATLWLQPDADDIFLEQTPEFGAKLTTTDLELNWKRLKKKGINSLISNEGFISDPFGVEKFKKLFSASKECLQDFMENSGYSEEDIEGLSQDNIGHLSTWILESDTVENILRPYLRQIMLNAAHGYLDFQSRNLGWREEEGGDRPIFFDPGYDFKAMREE